MAQDSWRPFDAPVGCPCTPELLCGAPDLKHFFPETCAIPRHGERTYSIHGGAGRQAAFKQAPRLPALWRRCRAQPLSLAPQHPLPCLQETANLGCLLSAAGAIPAGFKQQQEHLTLYSPEIAPAASLEVQMKTGDMSSRAGVLPAGGSGMHLALGSLHPQHPLRCGPGHRTSDWRCMSS